jgi:hypothetical protein
MEVVVGFLAFGLVVTIAAVLVIREAGRIARNPPGALFDPADAYEWVVEHLPDEVAATLSAEDVQRILDLQTEFFHQRGVSGNGTSDHAPQGPVVVGGAEQAAYIVRAAGEAGVVYLPEQIRGVIDTQLSYLRAIGAIGPPAREERKGHPDS